MADCPSALTCLALGALVVLPVVVRRYWASAQQLQVRRPPPHTRRVCGWAVLPQGASLQWRREAAHHRHCTPTRPRTRTHRTTQQVPSFEDSPALAALAQPEGHRLDVAAFVRLVRQEWAARGLAGARPLSDGELAALAKRAGFEDGLAPGQAPLRARAAARFAAWFHAQLGVIEAVGRGAYCSRRAQLICGFCETRAAAEAALVVQPPGTFCLRLGSPPASLVLSLADRRGRVQHYLFAASRLRSSGLPRVLEEVRGAQRLLDVASGRTWRTSIVRKELARSSA